jgi:hypothetical protein
MGGVGALIGLIVGPHATPFTVAVGVLMGVVVGWLSGRRFLLSILVGTAFGGMLAWALAGYEKISIGAGAGAAMGGFLGVWVSTLLDMWVERRQNESSGVPPAESS